MVDDAPRTSPLRHMLWLAWVLSAIYLGVGAVAAALNRVFNGSLSRFSLAMDSFAGSFLKILHLWDPLMQALARGRVETWELRLILVAISVALIFAYALVVGLLLSGVRLLLVKRGG
ncbi:MAG: hypothetical protein JST54_08480 [Deltaproteobacteria bacterium]|nr:hypothetical protein [Deltaproteobacteria bacterium]